MSNNKFKSVLASDTFRSIASAVICALVGIIVGFIILLIINAEHAPKAISVILKNFLYYRNKGKKLYYLGQTLVKAVPLILCGIAVLFAYKSGLFNIGVAGQYCIGIGISLWCALAWHLPWWLCLLCAVVCAAIWASLAGLLKAFCNVNEVIAGIMLNWISLYIVNVRSLTAIAATAILFSILQVSIVQRTIVNSWQAILDLPVHF